MLYLPVGRTTTLDAALTLVDSLISTVWSIEADDVREARALADLHRGLGARDLLHLACCRRQQCSGTEDFRSRPGRGVHRVTAAPSPAATTRPRRGRRRRREGGEEALDAVVGAADVDRVALLEGEGGVERDDHLVAPLDRDHRHAGALADAELGGMFAEQARARPPSAP